MRRVILMSLLIVAFLSWGVFGQGPDLVLSAGDVWIQDVTVISAERPVSLDHANVVLRGDRIRSVTDKPPRAGAGGVTVINGTGKYLVPGLIDGHVHLTEIPGMTAEQRQSMPDVVDSYFRQLPRSYLYFGFTAVVDLIVADPQRLNRLRAAELGPAIFDCGGALAMANGYPMHYLPPPVRFDLFPNFLYDATRADAIPARFAPGEHTPQRAVERVARGGASCVKSFYEPGFEPALGRLPLPSADLIRQVRDEARRRGLPLLLHANSVEAHRFAAEVGPDAVVHGLWNWQGSGDALPADAREVLDAEVRQQIAFMPTIRVRSGFADLFTSRFLDDPGMARVVPAALLAWYRTTAGMWFRDQVLRDFGVATLDQVPEIAVRRMRQRPRLSSQYVAGQGGRVAFGSDTPSAPIYTNPPGYNGYLELREMEEAGLTPRQILASATVENARLFKLEDYGTIEPKKIASLLLLRANPLLSMSAIDTIETVIIKGRVIPRDTLAANTSR